MFQREKRVRRLPEGERCFNKRNESEDYPKVKGVSTKTPECERCFNERNASKDYPKVNVFNKRNESEDYPKAKVFVGYVGSLRHQPMIKRTKGLPHCRLFRFLDSLNSGFNALGKSPL